MVREYFTDQLAFFDSPPTFEQMIEAYVNFDPTSSRYIYSSLRIRNPEDKNNYELIAGSGLGWTVTRLFVSFGEF